MEKTEHFDACRDFSTLYLARAHLLIVYLLTD